MFWARAKFSDVSHSENVDFDERLRQCIRECLEAVDVEIQVFCSVSICRAFGFLVLTTGAHGFHSHSKSYLESKQSKTPM
jgi:hypothetical protein